MDSSKTTWKLLLVVSVIVASLGFMAPTAPTCQPVEPGVPVCLTPIDCEGLDHIMCLGQWQCIEAVCQYQCGGSAECSADADCASDEVCMCMTACPSCVPGTECPPCVTECSCEAVGPQDADGDGFPAGDDCDDQNPAVNPGATELCDGQDNDCDGAVDEGGVCDPQPEPEICDGVDNDLDGLVDEGCMYCSADADCPTGFLCELDVVCPACVIARECKVACHEVYVCQVDESMTCGENGAGACADPEMACECRPHPDCPYCSSCQYGCFPSDERCRSQSDCWFGSACNFDDTPDYCSMIMAPVLPTECWGQCESCQDIACPMIACPPGSFMDPCTCACIGM
jgi:hypothetical protein